LSDAVIEIRPDRTANECKARLPLMALVTGDKILNDLLIQGYGHTVDFPELRERALSVWQATLDGRRVIIQSNDALRPHVDMPDEDAILFDPWDDAHTRQRSDVAAVFKRSLEWPPRHGLVYPAWPQPATVDLECGPPPDSETPIIAFCGVAGRPDSRREFIDKFREFPGIDFRIVERDAFCDADTETFRRMIREAHFVLCPIGVGRFSYRIYETLAAGRVPVLPNCSQVLPLEVKRGSDFCFGDGPQRVLDYWYASGRERIEESWRRNRATWIDAASPLGSLYYMAQDVDWHFRMAEKPEEATA